MFLKSFAARKSNIAIILSGMLVVTPAVGQVVGKTAAVNQDSTVEGRTLEIGASVVHKERIKTNARGTVQLLFIDRTTLSLGPNSDVVIDEYVFDPKKNTGKMTVSLSKGAMRFIGGQITHISSTTVNTPSASIGIRGGLVDINTTGKTTSVSNSFGVVTIGSCGGSPVSCSAPSSVPQGSTGTTAGGAPTVAVTTQQQVNSNNQQFQSKGGQTGGAPPGTSAAAATGSSSSTGITTSITPTSGPTTGSTASGPSSGSGGPNSVTTTFSGGLPTSVTSAGQAVQTSGGNSGATFAKPPPAPTPPAGKGGGGGPPPPPCCT